MEVAGLLGNTDVNHLKNFWAINGGSRFYGGIKDLVVFHEPVRVEDPEGLHFVQVHLMVAKFIT
ncbi:hypothetical protein J6590_067128 [Homalodisca vitripennis]|nr:hypothetical protein J6590_067128 [Homalodisca vitripennis]